MFAPVLHIPEGINFDCSGCGNCCFQWPVPATDKDVERIKSYTAGTASLKDGPRFRPLSKSVDRLKAFTHSLEKGEDGRCQYLDSEMRCQLHSQFGAGSKPSMCQLFPYTFTLTPTGAYASLSFASSGVLFNRGTPLTEQKEFLYDRLALFMQLFPCQPDWSNIQLIDGVSLSWIDYLLIEKDLLAQMKPERQASLTKERLLKQSQFIINKLPSKPDLDSAHLTKVRPVLVDQIFLKCLYETYFPADEFCQAKCEFDSQMFIQLLAEQPKALSLKYGEQEIKFKSLNDMNLGKLSNEALDLLTRFLYCRIFSKLYFGPGFGGLSLISGFHHLIVLVALLRLEIKLMLLSSGTAEVDYYWLAEAVRKLERRLTVANLTRESHAVFEVLLQSPSRVERILSLAS